MAAVPTIEIVTRKGKVVKCNKVRDYSNTKRIVYKLRFLVKGNFLDPITVIKIDEMYYVTNGESIIGKSIKLRFAIKIAASFAVDNLDDIEIDKNRYSYNRDSGTNLEMGKAGQTQLRVNRKAKRSRPIVFK